MKSDPQTNEQELILKPTPVFQWNMASQKRIKCNPGGTYSGKTYNILLVIFVKLLEKQRLATITSRDLPSLKKGALFDFEQRILNEYPELRQYIANHNKTDNRFTLVNNSVIEFSSFSDEADARSGKRDILFIDECNSVSWEIYWQLSTRTEEDVFLAWNPSNTFWAFDRLRGREDVEWIISNISHNPHASEAKKQELRELKAIDEMLYRVYALGLPGTLKGQIFTNVGIVQTFPANAKKTGYGLDFGYSNDPTALVKLGLYEGQIYGEELIYEKGLTNQDISERMIELGVSKTDLIVCDSAEPKSIEELRRKGWNVTGALKGRDSVKFSIDLLRQYRINLTADSTNWRKEIQNYIWKTKNGKELSEPIDSFNHANDAMRYWATKILIEKKPFKRQYFAFGDYAR